MYINSILQTLLLLCGTFSTSTRASPILSRNSTQWTFAEIPPSRHLVWYPCFTDYFCAVLDVPLDYLKPWESRSYIPLIKLAATGPSYQGMILTNPGGPGGSGIGFLFELAPVAMPIVGPNYDIVAWDPRGIGYALPSANCTLPANFSSSSLRRRAFGLYGPEFPDQYFENAYATAYQAGQYCTDSIGGPKQAGSHMSTAAVARDMISILDAYAESEDGKRCHSDASLLNFWGFSYGTFIGQTFASMFPFRVGRVVLDGVVDAVADLQTTDLKSITLTDEVFSTFFLYCNLAGPTLCPFYTGTTPQDIYLRFQTLVNKLNATYAFEQGWTNATAISIVLQAGKDVLFTFSYTPITDFPTIAELLVLLENLSKDLTLVTVEALAKQLGININASISVSDLWGPGVTCTDDGGNSYNLTLQDLEPNIQELEAQSWLAGELRAAGRFYCAAWGIKTDYRYTGPFGGRTKSPILFVSNTLDPVTPITNGQAAIQLFEGAQLLTIEGIGHSSLNSQNLCGWTKIGTFFLTGALPGEDNYCVLEKGPWNITVTGPLRKRSEIREITEWIGGLKG